MKRPIFASLALFLAPLAVPLVSSCRVLVSEYPVERTVDADSERILWDALRTAIYNSKHPVSSGAQSSLREIRSGWLVDAAPFKGKGFRTRVIANFAPSTGERKGVTTKEALVGYESFDVTIRVEKETNEALHALSLDRAKWTPADDDEGFARRIMQNFHGLLGTAEFEIEERADPFGIE